MPREQLIEGLEEDNKNCGKQKALEVKIKDLEYQLELETAGRQRSEIINERLKTKLDNSESDTTAMKQANIAKEEVNRKLERQLKELILKQTHEKSDPANLAMRRR